MEETKEIVLVQPEQLTRIMDLNQVYQLNQTSHDKAKEVSDQLLKKVWRDGLTEPLIEEIKQHMVRLKKTLDNMKARRSPVTQIFDEVRSRFTTMENIIDPAKKESLYSQFQNELDKWAKVKMDEEKRKREIAQKEMAVKTEEASIDAEIESQTKRFFEDIVAERKKAILECFTALTLESFDTEACEIDTMYPKFTNDDLIGIRGMICYLPQHHTSEWCKNRAVGITVRLLPVLQEKYASVMQEYRDDLKAQLPAKYNELEMLSLASSDQERETLEEKIAERQIEALNEIEQEKDQAVESAQAEAESSKAAGELDAMAQTALPFNDSLPKVKEGYEILVLNPAGWIQICQFYMQKEGMNEAPEKLEKKTLGSMKKFCEAYALKNDEKIISPHLMYEEKIKASVK